MAQPELVRAAQPLEGAGALLVCAGAGMGAESGLPIFAARWPPSRACLIAKTRT